MAPTDQLCRWAAPRLPSPKDRYVPRLRRVDDKADRHLAPATFGLRQPKRTEPTWRAFEHEVVWAHVVARGTDDL